MTSTNRATPGGTMLTDGYQALIAFAADTDIEFWEKTATPPTIDFGEPIDITTMHNTTWRSMVPRSLGSLQPFTTVVAYDPAVLDSIIALKGNEDWISYHFSDGSTWDFYGGLQSFAPSEQSEGAHPEATVTIVPTLTHPTTRAEVAPDYSATGTAT